jgi:preprotein translocase subunit SecD
MGRMRAYLIGTLVVVAGALLATFLSGNSPVLGLDLKGGISVTYAPVGKYNSSGLDENVNIINQRVNNFGVAEPDVSRQGNDIIVELPGVKDRAQALRLVGQTAQLRFRPVLANVPAAAATKGTPQQQAAAKTAVAGCDATTLTSLASAGVSIPTTSPAEDFSDQSKGACVVLREANSKSRLLLGPVTRKAGLGIPGGLTGNDVSDARSTFAQGQGYAVEMSLKSSGLKKFNDLAAASYGQSPPRNQVAIVLDARVLSAPAFQASNFTGTVQITGNFTPSRASDLAKVIKYGALPVALRQINSQDVSPTLGNDQLRAGIAAGIIGIALVALYMLVYYRILGLVVFAGLGVSGALLFAIVAGIGPSLHLALTLSGVTGIVVSIGITVDSYVVYFERLKDEIRAGRSVRSSVDRGFARSYRTIWAADFVSLLGAAALYVLAIGSVKGFALFLGIATILDLAVSYFFMHPLVSLMARRTELVRMRGVGMAAGLDVPTVTA